ncbi:MAG TPA: hypothetical protein PKB14_10590 [Rubrivivax sp.]|nr:hypothetical protein [Rubrivivax sp.]
MGAILYLLISSFFKRTMRREDGNQRERQIPDRRRDRRARGLTD